MTIAHLRAQGANYRAEMGAAAVRAATAVARAAIRRGASRSLGLIDTHLLRDIGIGRGELINIKAGGTVSEGRM